MVMLLSCPAKKVTKECGIGEALRLGAPARRAALPYVPHPARANRLPEYSNGKNLLSGAALPKVEAPLSPLCRFLSMPHFIQKIGTFFV